jgi:hypothetical protein
MNWTSRYVAAVCMIFGALSQSLAADMITPESDVPVPAVQQRGIWGAIAFAPGQNRHGFFWGADKKEEAEKIALEHCNNAGGKDCRLVKTFRNHRHWNDDDASGFPYEHCAALAIAEAESGAVSHWAAASAKTKNEALTTAKTECGSENACKIREWVCT